jgi:hypothetical protein
MNVMAFFIGFVVVLGALLFLLMFLVRRRNNSYQLFIIADNARNQVFERPKGYNLRIGKQGSLKAAKLYNHLISFFPKEVHPELANVSAFVWYGRTLYGVRSPTGDPEDDSIVLLKRPTVSPIDLQNTTSHLTNALFAEVQNFIKQKEGKIDAKELSDYIQSTITPQWYLQKVGVSNIISKEDILPRSIKLAYADEIEESFDLEKKHAGMWEKFATFMPAILLAILAIGIGVALAAAWQQIGNFQKEVYIETQSLQSYAQAINLAVGKALAAAHIYGYNFTLPSPPVPSSNATSSSILPPLPK